MTYTIENLPSEIDDAIRKRADAENTSTDRVMLDALRRGLGVEKSPSIQRDLSDIFDGTPLEPDVVKALEEQRQIDPEMWK